MYLNLIRIDRRKNLFIYHFYDFIFLKVEDNDGSKFKHKLTIFKSDPSDDGVIKVLVKNKFGEKTHQAKIGCVKAAKIVQPTKDCSAELGTSTTFHVIVDGKDCKLQRIELIS